MTQAIRATLEPNVDLARLNPNRGTWERIEGKKSVKGQTTEETVLEPPQ